MSGPFDSINPGGIMLNADGSITFNNRELRAAATKLGSQKGGITESDNFGTCTNSSSCGGSNLNCTNDGVCTGSNLGQCGGRGTSPHPN